MGASSKRVMPRSGKTVLNTFVRVDAERFGGGGSNALVRVGGDTGDYERAELEKRWSVKTGNGVWTRRGREKETERYVLFLDTLDRPMLLLFFSFFFFFSKGKLGSQFPSRASPSSEGAARVGGGWTETT